MTQEDKELLLKDICARLPYGVKLSCRWKTPAPNGTYGMICTMDSFLLDQIYNVEDTDVPFDEFKPYLFPLSSMTEEQKVELEQIKNNEDAPYYHDINDFFLKYHLDNRHLIEKGLAIDATGLNIY